MNSLVRDALKKSTYDKQDKFKEFISNNVDKIFTEEVLRVGDARVRNVLEGYWLGYSKPEKYSESGVVLENKVSFKKEKDNLTKQSSSGINMSEESIVDILLTVKNNDEFIPAFKEILWHFNNKPMTSKNILRHIVKVSKTGSFDHINQDDYPVTNYQFQKAIIDSDLKLIKEKYNGKMIYLYANPTNKRFGYFYEGKLWKLKELSEMYGVNIGTIQRRISKGMAIHKAIKDII
jgi:hypothetical protein